MVNFFSRPVVDRNGVTHDYLKQGSREELLQSGYYLDDLLRRLRHVDIVWFSRNDYVYGSRSGAGKSPLDNDEVHHTHHIRLIASGSGGTVYLASVTPDEPVHAYKLLFELLARQSALGRVYFRPGYRTEEDREAAAFSDFPISVETFSCLGDIVADRNNLEFAFDGFFFSQEHCRKLASLHPNIGFVRCSFADEGRFLSESIRSNRGPMKLSIICSTVDALALHNALCTASSLRSLRLSSGLGMFPLVFRSLAQYKSLIDFSIGADRIDGISERDLIDLFTALSKHSTLEKFSFDTVGQQQHAFDDETRARCSNVILNLLRGNKVLLELRLHASRLADDQFIMQGMAPYLQANLYRRRVKELVDESEQDFQRRLFSRALVRPQVNQTPTFMYMLLSGLHDRLAELYNEKKESDDAG